MMKREIEVKVLGKRHRFEIANDLEIRDFETILRYVEQKYKKIRSLVNESDSSKLGLLVSINLAEELLASKKEKDQSDLFLSKISRMIS